MSHLGEERVIAHPNIARKALISNTVCILKTINCSSVFDTWDKASILILKGGLVYIALPGHQYQQPVRMYAVAYLITGIHVCITSTHVGSTLTIDNVIYIKYSLLTIDINYLNLH